mgnify:CR=1 FL=1
MKQAVKNNVSKIYQVNVYWFVLIIIMVLINLLFHNKTPENDTFIGKWQTPGNNIVEIYENNSEYAGRILKLDTPLTETGEPRKDKFNSDQLLCNRPLEGLIILEKFKYNRKEKKLEGGKIYLPQEGRSFSCVLSLVNFSELKMKIVSKTFSCSEKWKRINN